MSMISEFATENYLKNIVKALAEPGRQRIGTGELSRLLGVTSGTATIMVKKLEREGYLVYQSHQGCSLTEAGRIYGLRVLRRHRILESFLFSVLRLDWTDIHDEAENLEHAASEGLIDAMDAYLGHPDRDPHGDPIPAKSQREFPFWDAPLLSLGEGSRTRIARVEGDKETLAYYQSAGLLPGAELQVLAIQQQAGLATLVISGQAATLALSALGGVYVESR